MQQPFDVYLAIEEGRSLRLCPRDVLDDALELARDARLTIAVAAIARELGAREGRRAR